VNNLTIRHTALFGLVLACSQGDFTEIAEPPVPPIDSSEESLPVSEELPSSANEVAPVEDSESETVTPPPVASADGPAVEPVQEPDEPLKEGTTNGSPPPPPKTEPTEPSQPTEPSEPPVDTTLEAFRGLPGTLQYGTGQWSTEPAFPNLTFDDPITMEQAPRTNTLYVAEREGKIYAFENEAQTETKVLALDLSSVTQGEGDSGLLGMAFHPEFGLPGSPNSNYVYVHYAFSETPPITGTRPSPAIPSISRLARFTVDPATSIISLSSELVLIDQHDDDLNHQGGAMFFHPGDGFLYLAVGDEGGALCDLQNCQSIGKDLFAGVLRIDVDMRGGTVSHPIVLQPLTGTTANYYIPNDNPFVGQSDVLEEFFALGLRSPHRMTFDAVDGLAWIGDVGQGQREEIDVLQAGANFQWPNSEGYLLRQPMPLDPLIGTWTDPVVDLARDEATCVIGGYVYRANNFPELQGRYVFGDYLTGQVWSLAYEVDGSGVQAKDIEVLLPPGAVPGGSITSFAVDATGELFILKLGATSQILKLAAATPYVNAPGDTSEIRGIADGIPGGDDSFHAYEVRSPLWSDGAVKQRWFSLPPGETINFSDTGPWTFPEGTIFVKHFAMALDEREPTELTPLETRFLVAARGGGYYGITYKWDASGEEPTLVLERQARDLVITLANGSTRRQRYEFPSPSDCLRCHSQSAGYVLGVRTEQVNREGATDPFDSQLLAWSDLGLLDRALDPSELESLPALANVADLQASPEDRVRSYWASNCSMCHGVDQEIRADWDARYETPLEEQGVVLQEALNILDPTNVYLVVPGDIRTSEMYRRISTPAREAGAMPPLGRRRPDPIFVQAMRDWIASLPAPASVSDTGVP
jgi:glucose/arabinose dehydrogenase